LREPRWLGIWYGPGRWLGILYGPLLCLGILRWPGLCSCIFTLHLCPGISHGLCSGILHRPDPSLLLHVPDRWPGIFHDRRLGILYRLHALDLRRCIFRLHGLCALDLWPCICLGRPGLELIQQHIGGWLTDFNLALIGGFGSDGNFAGCRRLACSRRQSLRIGG
jgi:hypothetical protein